MKTAIHIAFAIAAAVGFRLRAADGAADWIYHAQIGAGFQPGHGRYFNVENIWYYTNFFYKDQYSEKDRREFAEKVRAAHANGMRVITYAGPLEVVSEHVDRDGDGKVDKGAVSFAMRHPDYLQVGISGRPAALLGSVVAKESFWVGKDAEDAWLTPNNPKVLEAAIKHVLELASFGVDGIWLDVPHMNSWWVEGVWEDEYPSYDKFSVALFKKEYGYPPPRKVDWNDPKWRGWIDFRYRSITDFISAIHKALRAKYPKCELIVEHWMGVGPDSCDKACSAYLIRDACDIRGHEVECATYSRKSLKYYNILRDVALFSFYRDIYRPDPTWILAYADSDPASLTLNAEALFCGANLYEAKPPEMEGCVNPDLRRRVFSWVMGNKDLVFSGNIEKTPTVGIFYSTASEFYGDPSWSDDIQHTDSFWGISMMLMRLGVPFKTVIDAADADGLEAVVVPHITFKTKREDALLEKISGKCRLVRDRKNLGWKFWKASKSGPNWADTVSDPPDERRCGEIQREFAKLLGARPMVEFDCSSGFVPLIFRDKRRDRYIVRVVDLRARNGRKEAEPGRFEMKLNIPDGYSRVREVKFLEDGAREFELPENKTVSSEIKIFAIYEISKKNGAE